MALMFRHLLCPLVIATIAWGADFETHELQIPAAAAAETAKIKKGTKRVLNKNRPDVNMKGTKRQIINNGSKRPRTCAEGYHWSSLWQECFEDAPSELSESDATRRVRKRP